MSERQPEESEVIRAEDAETARHYHQELRMRLDKLSRTYDLTTMKIFMAVEALGENNVYSVYDPERRSNWEPYLVRREACRLDLTRHEKTRNRYEHFLVTVGREEQGRQFFNAMIGLMIVKGALDVSHNSGTTTINNNNNNNDKRELAGRYSSNSNNNTNNGISSNKYRHELESSFCGHLCKLFDKKLHTWFDAFEAVNVRLTAHVKVSNFVRVLTGQVDALCRKRGLLYAVNVKVTGMATPRPLDLMELCQVKAMIIQNGLAAPDQVVLCLLTCHLGADRPVLRLWEYRPTLAMDNAVREADIDRMIEAGRASQYHELWSRSVCPPSVASLTARQMAGGFIAYDDGGGGGGDGRGGDRFAVGAAAAVASGTMNGRAFNTHDKNITRNDTNNYNRSNGNSNNINSNNISNGNPYRVDGPKHSDVTLSRPLMQTIVH